MEKNRTGQGGGKKGEVSNLLLDGWMEKIVRGYFVVGGGRLRHPSVRRENRRRERSNDVKKELILKIPWKKNSVTRISRHHMGESTLTKRPHVGGWETVAAGGSVDGWKETEDVFFFAPKPLPKSANRSQRKGRMREDETG